MVQGSLKKKPAGGSTSKRPSALAPKRGPRQIAPKKASLIKQQKLTKVCPHHFRSMDHELPCPPHGSWGGRVLFAEAAPALLATSPKCKSKAAGNSSYWSGI
ncbi:DUF2462 domain-containing protein [Aspergillus saccharolyticus JOP 1030-1]|uniref:Uncharacterized protein n=1 Tax=Aspergillus saccharolyticus JOP 1030-1 TaxID=1450539 RepID=A0A319A856_9EURO|nr:hypothetical protein BP01DRAFT_358807 [Aspergillus saccharolyticus JOP 1030-1]PYH43282.1 hypothetical protein BP01DRAFT_358807 [Aspergillus saccharolyticus JOP 1030-1]